MKQEKSTQKGKDERKARILQGVLFFILALIIWQYIAVRVDRMTYQATSVGELLELDTYNAACYPQGQEGTLVVFIAGSGTPSAYTDFYELQSHLPDGYRSVSFDHAGMGGSSLRSGSNSIENLVNELNQIIDHYSPDEAVVLVCHSLGALEAVGYAQAYPEKVKGILVLDGGTPDFYAQDSELLAMLSNMCNATLRTTGLYRLMGTVGIHLPMYGENVRNKYLSSDLQKWDLAMLNRCAGSSSNRNLVLNMNENAKTIISRGALGDLPILVLGSDSGEQWTSTLGGWNQWSSQVQTDILEGASHYLHWTYRGDVESYLNLFLSQLQVA